jgi:hypothetical protein
MQKGDFMIELVELLKKMTLSDVAAFVSLIVAFFAYWNSRKKNSYDVTSKEDQELCIYASKVLEESYRELTQNGLVINPVEANRLNWLTSARLILRHQEIKSKIKSDVYILICEENERHWEHEFYKILQHSELMSGTYFKGNKMFNSCENISPDSAVVVFKFARWRRNYEDPLETINYKKLLNDEPEILNGRNGLESYLDDLHEKVK